MNDKNKKSTMIKAFILLILFGGIVYFLYCVYGAGTLGVNLGI
jgi:hypothetical protein